MMWEDRPWWFNCFIAWPVALAIVAFLPFGYFLCPPFRSAFGYPLASLGPQNGFAGFRRLWYVDGICWALEDSYAHIHDAHKLDPVG